jgi:hypothetical protein
MSVPGTVFRVSLVGILAIHIFSETVRGQPALYGISVVAPNSLENVEGNSVGSFPFDGFRRSMRFQQVYDSSQFSQIADGGGYLLLIALRAEGTCSRSTGIGQSISNLQISLSTTTRRPDALSSVFAENVGIDETIVFGPRASRLDGICTPNGPRPFTAIFRFASWFFYRPTDGNLLLDIRNISGPDDDGSLAIIDGEDTTGDSISSIVAFDSNALSASEVSSFGYVTYFNIQPTPRLHLALMLTNLLFRWVNHPGNWALQRTAVLGAGMIWQPAGGTVTTNAGYRESPCPWTQTRTLASSGWSCCRSPRELPALKHW